MKSTAIDFYTEAEKLKFSKQSYVIISMALIGYGKKSKI